jgi:hypothetical protein
MRAPSDGEKTPIAQRQKRKELQYFNFDSEIISIRTMIRDGNLKEAMTGIYVASRKMALIHGINVPDSMTHNEFFADIAGRYPTLSQPLSSIVGPYELVTFAGRAAGQQELDTAVNGLKEFYLGLKNEEVGEA